ncbi:MAG: caspase family protein [Verrucomicrobiales bacterium]|nr:caspase family protein [Verrucomicrobiales bacterium]
MKPLLLRSIGVGLALAATPLFAAQYALVIGINDYPGSQMDLGGCLADVQRVHTFLTQVHGFPAANVLVLKDAQATATGIENAFKEHLIAKAQPGDAVVFSYSGHGTQVPDLNAPDEDDDMDECLCPYDITPRQQETWFTDDRLRGLIGQLKTDRVLILLDCCHSGTGTRGFREQPPIPGSRYMHLGFDRPERASRNFAISKAMRSVRAGGNHTLLAACSSDEVARDAGPQVGGIFTATFIDEASRGSGSSLEALMATAKSKIVAFVQKSDNPNDTQTPQLEGQTKVSLTDFLGAQPGGSLPPPTSQPPASPPTAPGDNSAFPVKLTAAEQYQDGEFMTCTINSAKDGYLRLYYTDAQQKTYMIFPNKFQQDGQIKGSANIAIPGSGAGFALKVYFPKELLNAQGQPVCPQAQEILSAVVSPVPFSDAANDKWLGKSAFIEFGNKPRRAVLARGIDVVRAEAGLAHFIYSINPPAK